jgi:hypothetical protein
MLFVVQSRPVYLLQQSSPVLRKNAVQTSNWFSAIQIKGLFDLFSLFSLFLQQDSLNEESSFSQTLVFILSPSESQRSAVR